MLAPQHDQFEEAGNLIAIEEIAPDTYRVAGSVAFRQLAKQLGIDVPEGSYATVAGFIQRHNARLPRLGDRAVLGDFELSVVEEDEGDLRIDVRRRDRRDDPSTQDVRGNR